jgi:predicted enzyme related to lactoylglutathione lyase
MPHGAICHIELPTSDLAASQRFYEELFEWSFTPLSDAPYALFSTPEGVGGGFDAGPEAKPHSEGGPTVLIEVDDIEAALERVVKLGGQPVLGKTRISDELGFFAVFIDNVGNRVGLWSPE